MKSICLPLALGFVLQAGAALASEEQAGDTSTARGEQVFTQHCSTCHGDAGIGAEPWYPSLQRLAGLREPSDMIETLLAGRFRRAGEINGHTIPIMPSWGQLSDADVAATVNYIQANWGDQPAEVTAADVAAARATLWQID